MERALRLALVKLPGAARRRNHIELQHSASTSERKTGNR